MRGRGRCLITLALRGAPFLCLRITLPMRQCPLRSARLAGRSLRRFSFGTTQTGFATSGGGARKVNTSAEPVALLPATVVTVTSTAPGVAAGDLATIFDSESTL